MWNKLCIPSASTPSQPPAPKKMEKLIDIYLVFISLNFWIFKYLSTYKPLIGTQGHGNIVLA